MDRHREKASSSHQETLSKGSSIRTQDRAGAKEKEWFCVKAEKRASAEGPVQRLFAQICMKGRSGGKSGSLCP